MKVAKSASPWDIFKPCGEPLGNTCCEGQKSHRVCRTGHPSPAPASPSEHAPAHLSCGNRGSSPFWGFTGGDTEVACPPPSPEAPEHAGHAGTLWGKTSFMDWRWTLVHRLSTKAGPGPLHHSFLGDTFAITPL